MLAWDSQLRNVCFTATIKRNVFTSPDGRKEVVAEHNGFHVGVAGTVLNLPKGANDSFYPSEVAWSPSSEMFFVNNGDGSGTDGWTLQVFQLRGSAVTRGQGFNAMVVAAFRKAVGCPASAVDPNVRGLGWSKDGSELFAFAQSTVSASCGPQGTFRGVVLNLKTGSIEHFYPEATTRHLFHDLLPFNMR
jgi:DNA-binding beta-propeller fold protein YncE